MKRVKVDLEFAPLLSNLAKKGYAVGDGKATKQISYKLNMAGFKVFHGYDQDAKKVVLALEHKIEANRRRRTLKSVFFDLKEV